jgi:hypothetical protein
MHHPRSFRYLFTLVLAIGFTSAAFGQATRTWVSGVGDDVNPCSRTAPCKTFAGAISKTADKGEISVLDPGGFGTVTITKSITLNGTGTLAGILSAGTNGINVNDSLAASPGTSVVIVRDVSINGAGTGTRGLNYISGKSVLLDHCWINGINGSPGRGIDVNLSLGGNLKAIDTVIENVTDDAIHINTSSSFAFALIEKCRIFNAGQDGIEAVNNVRMNVTNSQVYRENANGIVITGGNTIINMDDVLVANCEGTAVRSAAGCQIRVSDSFIANNATGLNANGGTLESFQGNSVLGNSTPGAFTATTPKQ